MKKRGVESIELPAAEESFESVRSYFRRRLEAVLGILQNLINAAGDIVTVTIEEQKQKGRRHGQND